MHLIHWLCDLGFSSTLSANHHPSNPSSLVFPAVTPSMTGAKDSPIYVGHHYGGGKIEALVSSDLWSGIKLMLCEMAEMEKPKGYAFFRQPPAMILRKKKHKDDPDDYAPNDGRFKGIPACENVENIETGFEYWARAIPGKDKEWVKVFVQGEYGRLKSGKPVYPEFNGHYPRTDSPPDSTGTSRKQRSAADRRYPRAETKHGPLRAGQG